MKRKMADRGYELDERACRTAALRVAHAYRTMSDIAISVIAEMSLNDLIAAERAKMCREGRRTEEDDVSEDQSRNR